MSRYALMLCTGLLAAVVTACVAHEVAPPPPLPPPAGSPRMACTVGNENSFIDNIGVLNPAYNPNLPPGRYQPPYYYAIPFDPNKNAGMTADLKNAFKNASPSFQQHLCELRGRYINPVACSNSATYDQDNYRCKGPIQSTMQGAWGFRSFYKQSEDLGSMYISIPAQLWVDKNGQPTDQALMFNNFEDILMGELASWRTASSGPYVTKAATPNDSWMTVLAVMAHEYGHVHWANTVLPGRVGSPSDNGPGGNNYEFSSLTSCPNGFGGFDFFEYWDYNGNENRLRPKDRWRVFNRRETAGNVKIDHAVAPYIKDFESTRLSPDEKSALFVLLYNARQPWASYFGSNAADEDFVETYVLKVLTNAQTKLVSLPVTVKYTNGAEQDVDIAADLTGSNGKAVLAVKMGCIAP